MRRLTLREQVLIYIACVLGILCLGFWLMGKTAYRHYGEAREALEAVRLESALAGSEERAIGELEKNLMRQEILLREYKDMLTPFLSDAGMEQQVTSMLEENGLKPVFSQIYGAKPYQETEEVTILYTGRVVTKSTGTLENICGLLDQVSESIRIRTVTYSITREEGGYSLLLALDIYMMREGTAALGIYDN